MMRTVRPLQILAHVCLDSRFGLGVRAEVASSKSGCARVAGKRTGNRDPQAADRRH